MLLYTHTEVTREKKIHIYMVPQMARKMRFKRIKKSVENPYDKQ